MEYRECSTEKCGNPVFARGICRKHYDRERLANADPCKIDGCTVSAAKRGMCENHYQAWRVKQQPLCKVENCTEHSLGPKYGLCRKHEFRLKRHDSLEQPRAADWGAREQHPLYQSWHWHKRVHNLCDEWRDDFWLFVEVVGDRPGNHTLRRKDTSKQFDTGNWHWKESHNSENKAAYARKWRAVNPEKAKNSDLKKRFGITLSDYERMFEEQNGVCAICEQPEKSHQRDGSPSSLVVDHCHDTKKIRGLLCHHCNRGIGFLQDSSDILLKAAVYLDESNTVTS
jgi:hypothetical protein